LKNKLIEIFKDEFLVTVKEDLSSITIRLPQNNTSSTGVYYYILKQLAWKNISITEVVSTSSEFTIVVKDDDLIVCFQILRELKNKS